MKTKRKVILGSALSIAMCASMIAGTTYALFTSESEVNIAVTSAKVSVKAEVDTAKAQTKQLGEEYAAGLENALGDKITLTKDSVQLGNIAPGDGVKFPITVTNKSSINVKYRETLVIDVPQEATAASVLRLRDQLSLDRLKIMIDGKRAVGGNFVVGENKIVVTDWTTISSEIETSTHEVSIELDENAQTLECGGKQLTLHFVVEAVQANAGYAQVTEIKSPEELLAFAKKVNAGETYADKTVVLSNDIEMAGKEMIPIGTREKPFKGLFDGKGFKISNLTINNPNADGVGLFGAIAGNAVVRDVTLDKANITGLVNVGGIIGHNDTAKIYNVSVTESEITGGHYVGGIVGFTYGAVLDCVVSDTTVEGIPFYENGKLDNGDKVGGIVGFVQNTNLIGNSVTGVDVRAFRDVGGIAGHLSLVNEDVFVKEFSENVATDSTVTTVSYEGLNGKVNKGELFGRIRDDGAVYSKNENNLYYHAAFDGKTYGDIIRAHSHNNSWKDVRISTETSTDEIENIYYILNLDGLKKFRDKVNSGETFEGRTVLLVNDIDLKGEQWTPIGECEYITGDRLKGTSVENFNYSDKNYADSAEDRATYTPFVGTFDGNGHTIKNLTIGSAATSIEDRKDLVGLFGVVGYVETTSGGGSYIGSDKGGIVKNFTLENVKVYGREIVGSAVAYLSDKSEISNVHVNNAVLDGGHFVGGVVGYANFATKISECSIETATVNADVYTVNGKLDNGDKVGGLVAYTNGATVENCAVTDVTVKAFRDLGGLIGCASTTTQRHVEPPTGSDPNRFYQYANNVINGNQLENVTVAYNRVGETIGTHTNENIEDLIGRIAISSNCGMDLYSFVCVGDAQTQTVEAFKAANEQAQEDVKNTVC